MTAAMALTEPAVTWQNLWRGFAINDIASRPLLNGKDLDAATDHARAVLAALLRVPVAMTEPADACPLSRPYREPARRRGWGREVRWRRPARAG